MRNQKGFATLEIIMVMLIISALAGVIIPKATRIIDTATLDYETKKFRSEFFFARSSGRSATYDPKIFISSPISKGNAITFKTDKNNYRIEQNGKFIREENFLSRGFSIQIQGKIQEISFDSAGKNGKTGTYTFTSPLKNKRNLVLDSVGRLRIDKND